MRGKRDHIRLAIRAGLYALAVGLFPLSAAAQGSAGSADFQRFMASAVGNSTTVGIATNGVPVAVAAQNGLPTGAGWATAGNYGVAKGATVADGIKIAGKGSVSVAGRMVPATVASAISAANLVKGLRAVAGPGLLFTGLPLVLQWLADSGVKVNPNSTGSGDAFLRTDTTRCTVAPCYEYRATSVPSSDPYHRDRMSACARAATYMGTVSSNYNYNFTVAVKDGPWWYCQGRQIWKSSGADAGPTGVQLAERSASVQTPGDLPASMDDIAPYLQAVQPAPGVVQELLQQGARFDVMPSTVTGPSTVVGPSKEVQNADGTRTVSITNHNYTYEGAKITNTSNVTTSTTYNSSNVQTGQTTTTETPSQNEDTRTECEKNPNSLNCADLDTPEAEIPRDTFTVSYQEQNLFGEGACPADVMVSVGTLGQTVKAWDWHKTCSMALPLRAMVIALATFAAALIVFPTKVDV